MSTLIMGLQTKTCKSIGVESLFIWQKTLLLS